MNRSNLNIFVLRWANICIMKLFGVKFEKPVVENIFFSDFSAMLGKISIDIALSASCADLR